MPTESTSGSIRATITPSGNIELDTLHRGGLLGSRGNVEILRADITDVIAVLQALQAPAPEGVTFPVELEEDEARVLDALIREKYMPERSRHSMPDGPSRLLRKVHDVMRKFHEKRIADAEFAASLTEEERNIIRARRADGAK